jgi:hypothetical protein
MQIILIQILKIMKKLAFLLSTLIVLASCSSIRVSTDFDKSAGFSTYKTYAFTADAKNLPVDDINKTRILNAVTAELAAKGFTASEKPDVLIDLKIKAKQVQTATTSNNYYGSGYRYRWGGGFSSATINYDSYTEGTLFIDMIDAAKNQLVWQGRGTGTIDPDVSAQKREQNINYAVKQIFTKYPPKF